DAYSVTRHSQRLFVLWISLFCLTPPRSLRKKNERPRSDDLGRVASVVILFLDPQRRHFRVLLRLLEELVNRLLDLLLIAQVLEADDALVVEVVKRRPAADVPADGDVTLRRFGAAPERPPRAFPVLCPFPGLFLCA